MNEYYTDGSWQGSYHPDKSGWGFVHVVNNNKIGEGNGSSIPEGKHITGEMMGVMKAVQDAQSKGLKSIVIVHDNEGVAFWANGSWKAKNTRTQGYAAWMQARMKEMSITFRKVKAHDGNQWNDYVDNLAKQGVAK